MRDVAEAVVGANGANAKARQDDELEDEWSEYQLVRTSVNCSNVLEWAHKKHKYDPHAEDLHTPARHVQHEGLHGQRFSRRDCKIPCALLSQARV